MKRVRILTTAGCLFLLSGVAGDAGATVYQFNNGLGGAFENPGNWIGPGGPGVPGPGDEAEFNAGAVNYTVTFSSDPVNLVMDLSSFDGVDFDLGGHVYTLLGANGDAIRVGPGSLRLIDGVVDAQDGRVVVEDPSGVWFALIEVLSDAALEVDSGDLQVGDTFAGEVRVEGVLAVEGTTFVAPAGFLTVDGGAMAVGPSVAPGGANTLRIGLDGRVVVEGGAGVGTPSGPISTGTLQVESDGAVEFAGGTLIAESVDVLPGGSITAVNPAPDTHVESTLRANTLGGFGPGLVVPDYLNLQLGHSLGGSSVTLIAAPLQLDGADATLTVGYDADATLTLNSGGTAAMPRLIIGDEATGDGVVDIVGPGTTWTVEQNLSMGGDGLDNAGGRGELNVLGGAQLISHGASIGLESGAQSTVTVLGSGWTTDTGPILDASGWLRVGSRGTGILNVYGGSLVTAHVIRIGNDLVNGDPDGWGEIHVRGSTLVSSIIDIGAFATGLLHVGNGGLADADSGSSTSFRVGERGTVLVDTGGRIDSSSGLLVNGDFANSGQDPVVTVRDGGSTWTINGPLDVGVASGAGVPTGASLVVESGGTVSAQWVRVGVDPFNSGLIRVDGAGSTLTDTLSLGITIGAAGGSGVVEVLDGGVVTSRDVFIGQGAGFLGPSQGTVLVDAGTWDAGADEINVADGIAVGTLELRNGGQVFADVVRLSAGGTLSGSGHVTADIIADGTTAPGGSTGILSVTGNYLAGPGGTLEIELAGAGGVAGVDHDLLSVTGVLGAAGLLDVTLLGGYAPSFGHAFDILDFASTTGSFDQVLLPALGANLAWDESGLLITGALLVSSNLLGDANNDGTVTADDLVAVQQHFGDTGPANGLLLGDADDDGAVTADDLIAVQQNFGHALMPAPGDPLVRIPEPGTLALVALLAVSLSNRGALAGLRRRRVPPAAG